MERRDSKKGGNKQKQKDPKTKPDESEDERKRKSSGVSRSKPCREIYRPPSVRKGRGNGMDNSGDFTGVAAGSNSNHAQSAPLHSSARPFNVYAKEFQYSPRGNPLSYSRSQSIAYYSNSTTDYYQNPILATSGCYPLQQSKSSGTVNNFYQLWAQQQQQAMAQQQQQQQQQQQPPLQIPKRRTQNSLSEATSAALESDESQYFRLQQSKSSGNLPNRMHRGSKTVRFDCEDSGAAVGVQNEDLQLRNAASDNRILKMQRDLEMAGKSMENLRLNGQASKNAFCVLPKNYEGLFPSKNHDIPEGFQTPGVPGKFNPPQLQKSYTFFGLPNAYSNSPKIEPAKANAMIKRSKSYTPRSTTNSFLFASSPNSLASISAASDFDIAKWPKDIQESVTSAVIGADRVPARHRINMVGSIFNTLLSGNSSRIEEEREKSGSPEKEAIAGEESQNTGSENPSQLITSSVNIFLYFIQREKDRTVMETVLNTCFATFQQIQKTSLRNYEVLQSSGENRNEGALSANADNNTKLVVFLQFLSTLYGKVKIIRLQNTGVKSIDEMNHSVLSLLCDSCLMTLRLPLFHTFEIMDLLFTIMTSIGREMEGTFPLKMKQLLAAVRDALLGIKPQVVGMELSSPSVQKTLMQLIELHAANWHLPASAVRYYYSNPS